MPLIIMYFLSLFRQPLYSNKIIFIISIILLFYSDIKSLDFNNKNNLCVMNITIIIKVIIIIIKGILFNVLKCINLYKFYLGYIS